MRLATSLPPASLALLVSVGADSVAYLDGRNRRVAFIARDGIFLGAWMILSERHQVQDDGLAGDGFGSILAPTQ